MEHNEEENKSEMQAYRCLKCNKNFIVPKDLCVCPHCLEGFIEEINQDEVQDIPQPRDEPMEEDDQFPDINNYPPIPSFGVGLLRGILGGGVPSHRPRQRPSHRLRRHRDSSNSSSESNDLPMHGIRMPEMPEFPMMPQSEPGRGQNYFRVRSIDGQPVQIVFGSGGSSRMMNMGSEGMEPSNFRNFFERLLNNFGLQNRSDQQPASQETIENLKEIEISEDHYDTEGGEPKPPACAICTDEMAEKAIELPCKHLFHKECISKWIEIHHICPVCRKPVEG
ncbi:unnamed protein product [Moneuplotes crassus]|uniref:RING-type domain-containing protein n=1 Tax=Euplotes crassus TaxID=5936 RepID=A0AAD1XNF5_EUPCR|nr:unnamed protein product [Moneuplotes crassus]